MYLVENLQETKFDPKNNEWCRNFSHVPQNKLIEVGFLCHSDLKIKENELPKYSLTVYLAKARKKFFVITFLDVRFNYDFKWTIFENATLSGVKLKSNHRLPDVWREIKY